MISSKKKYGVFEIFRYIFGSVPWHVSGILILMLLIVIMVKLPPASLGMCRLLQDPVQEGIRNPVCDFYG